MVFDDEKLRLTLSALADILDERVRLIIYKSYTDPRIMMDYETIRSTRMFERGGKSKVHRMVIRFPNGYVYDFLNKVMGSMYGPDWLDDRKALKHDLVRPWWVVNKL